MFAPAVKPGAGGPGHTDHLRISATGQEMADTDRVKDLLGCSLCSAPRPVPRRVRRSGDPSTVRGPRSVRPTGQAGSPTRSSDDNSASTGNSASNAPRNSNEVLDAKGDDVCQWRRPSVHLRFLVLRAYPFFGPW